jgi:hypothetical protein
MAGLHRPADEGCEAARLVLKLPQSIKVFDAFFQGLDMAEHHGCGRSSAQLVPDAAPVEMLRTGTDNMTVANGNAPDYGVPSVIRNPRANASQQVRALETSGMEHYDIPAFLRRQAD